MGQSHPPHESSAVRVKACLPCAKVKARCEVDNGHQACNRCRRLKKTCTGQAPGAHRRMKGNVNRARVDDSSEGTQSPADSADAFIDRIVPSNVEGSTLLQMYQDNYAPQFPFVVLDPRIQYEDVKESKPLLLLAVLMVSLRHDPNRQESIARRIREIVSHDLLSDEHKNLDFLQCLLVTANWYHLHLHLGSQFGNIVHLIMATLVELGLNKEASFKFPVSGLGRFGYFGKAGSVLNLGAPEGSTRRTLEERRAFLGCFFLTSVTSLCIRDIEPLMYSKYAEACCSALVDAAEYPSDICAAHLARLHGVTRSHASVLSQDECRKPLVTPNASAEASLVSAETDLAMLMSTLPLELRHNVLLTVHYHILQIFLYDGAVDLGSSDPSHSTMPLARIRMLQKCQEATMLAFDAFETIPHPQLLNLSYTTLNLIGHVIVVASKLDLLRINEWNATMMPSNIDFSGIIARLIQGNIDAAAAARSEEGCRADEVPARVPLVFRKLPDTLRKIEAVHEAMAASQSKLVKQQPQLPFPYSGDIMSWEELFEQSVEAFPEVFDEDFFHPFREV